MQGFDNTCFQEQDGAVPFHSVKAGPACVHETADMSFTRLHGPSPGARVSGALRVVSV